MATTGQQAWQDQIAGDPELRGSDHRRPKGLTLPKKRKLVLFVLALITLVNVILTIMATINPVPTFSASAGLLVIRAAYPNDTDTQNSPASSRAPIQQHSSLLQADQSLLPGVQPLVARGQEHGETEYWDTGCGCVKTRTLTATTTRYSTKVLHPKTTITLEPTSLAQPIGPSTTGGPGGNDNRTTTGRGDTGLAVVQGSFAALFLGVSGGCLQKRSGVLVCTSSSFMPSYSQIYEETGLAANVTAQLPGSTGGASLGLLVAIISLVFTLITFAFSLLPKTLTYGPTSSYVNHRLDMRHQWAIAFATGLATISLFAVVGSVISLRNTFGASAAGVEAWDITRTLQSSLLSAFSLLYATSVMSAVVVVTGLSLIAWDFKNPWFFDQLSKKDNPWSHETAAVPAPHFEMAGRDFVAGTTVAGSAYASGTGLGSSTYR